MTEQSSGAQAGARGKVPPEPAIKTPMMKQYFDIKAENPGALVMFRLGDFYEFFGEDAQIASRELDIVLTGRDAGMPERMPMCGVPHHALEQYLYRLIQKGYRVCICEQLEDAKSAKGLVKRGVTRVVTPGTAMAGTRDEESAYIAAVLHGEEDHWAFAVSEASTGLLRMCEFRGAGCLADLSGEILRLKPREILISENDYLLLTEWIRLWTEDDKGHSLITLRPGASFSREEGQTRLANQFELLADGVPGDSGPGSGRVESDGEHSPMWLRYPLAGDCAAALLAYLEETQKAEPVHVRELELDQPAKRLQMDPTTFRNLEVTRNLRTFEKKGSLLDLMDHTRTAFGARLLRSWLETPLVEQAGIEARLDAVECIKEDWSRRQDLRKHLSEIYDMERLMTRVIYQRATPRELLALRASFGVLPAIRRLLGELSHGAAEIAYILHDCDELKDLFDCLSAALSEDIPNNWKEGGFIRPGYHPDADACRNSAQNGRSWMLELEQKERESSGIRSLKIGYNKIFGYYFEVTKSNISAVPEYFQRKQTLASGERFVTEELIRLEGLVLGAEEKLAALEMELFREILAILTAALPRIRTTASVLAKLDAYQSLAELAASGKYCRPRFQPAGDAEISIKDLRHPALERIVERGRFVPNDICMDGQTSLYVITGPNMGGKSTFCRSVALAFLMAQTGSFVPAASAILPLRDRIFARVGAGDDLRGGQSTFMVEMSEVAHILEYATENSLVILDEVGRGTGTYDGLSVAWAVSRYLAGQIKAKTLFATHYLELTSLEGLYPGVKNLSLAVEEEGERIVFLHRILPGPTNKSYGIHVAELAGLPEEVVADARAKLVELENSRQMSHIIEDLDDKRDIVSSGGLPENREGQLSLFAPQERCERDGLQSRTGQKEKGRNALDKALLGLKNRNLESMTPIDALNYLYKLQKSLRSAEDGDG